MDAAPRFMGWLFLTVAIATSGAICAARPAQDVQVRVYDADHKDYHTSDDRKDRAYRHYLEERREQYRKFDKLKDQEQREYWKWRHSHPD